MATNATVHLDASQQPQFYVKGLSPESADKVSKLLQVNHEKHHIFFNNEGFHNHIAHHLLTIFALGATPEELQRGYNINASYQRPPEPLRESDVKDMHQPERFKTYLGKENHYHDFLVFFQEEIGAKGWQNVLNEYLFAGDERADDMLVRLYAGFLHPIIHLGFGIEFQQPAIIAEALAQAAVHDNWMAALFKGCEKAAEQNRGETSSKKTIVQLLEEIKSDEKLSKAAHWKDGNKIRDGILSRAPDEMVRIASQYTITENDLEEKTAEMINAAVYYTSTAQKPPHQAKIDFFYMHCVNCSIFFSNFLSATNSFLTPATKRRLLEWKVWNDLAMYASRGCPTLLIDEVKNYNPTKDSGWAEVFKRANKFEDDGHASKLVRALANGQQVCTKYENNDGFIIKGDMWNKLGHMAIDSVEAGEPHWVRSCGFEQAWEQVPLREGARL